MQFGILSTRRNKRCRGIWEAQCRKSVWDKREVRDRSLRAGTEKILLED